MIAIVRDNLDAIAHVCTRHHVRRMDMFGSGANGTFDPTTSDLDFLVLFDRSKERNFSDEYFDLLSSLQQLLGAKVDLVDIRAARNPFFIAEALKNRVQVYAA